MRLLFIILASLVWSFTVNSQTQFVSGLSWKRGDSTLVGPVEYYAKKDIATANALPKENQYWTTARIIIAEGPVIEYVTKEKYDSMVNVYTIYRSYAAKQIEELNRLIDSLTDPQPPPPPPPPPTRKIVRLDDFKYDGELDYFYAWIRAKDAIPDSGTILLGHGTYSIDSGINDIAWYLEKNNITIQGEGIDKTIITSGGSTRVTMSNSVRLDAKYVKGFYTADTSHAFTYTNDIRKNSDSIVLKNNQWLDSINVGDKLMIVGGSHYFDQEFGELATVVRKTSGAVYLKDKLSGSYSVDSVPYGNSLKYNISIPEIGDTVTVTVDKYLECSVGRMLNIGDNLFGIKAYTDSTITFVNVGRGNWPAGTIIPAGTHLMKPRTALVWNHTQNLKIKDLTIRGNHLRVLRLDNTYGAEISNVKITRDMKEKGGFIYTTDFCRDIKFQDCIFESLQGGSGSQISRSAGDIYLTRNHFINTKTDCSEYSFNVNVDSNVFDLNGSGFTFILGGTVRTSYITNNIFNVDTAGGVIISGEIQNLNNIQREFSLVKGNTFNIKGYAASIYDPSAYGKSYFIENRIQGEGALYSFSGSMNRTQPIAALYPHHCYVMNNSIDINIVRSFCVGGMYSGEISGNKVQNRAIENRSVFLNYTTTVNQAIINSNLFYGFLTPRLLPVNVILGDNDFRLHPLP